MRHSSPVVGAIASAVQLPFPSIEKISQQIQRLNWDPRAPEIA
jgi:hypothetical protein